LKSDRPAPKKKPAPPKAPQPGGPSVMEATITPRPVEPRAAGPVVPMWLGAATIGLAVLVLAVGLGVLAAVFLVPSPAPVLPEPTAIAVTPDLPEPVAPEPVAPAPVAPAPVAPVPAAPVPVPVAPVAAPVPGPAPGPGPVPAPPPAPEVPPECADLLALQERAEQGGLTGPERVCLSKVFNDPKQPLSDRTLYGRVLVDDAHVRCETQQDCAAYEREQIRYFKIDETDPSLMLAFARYLLSTSRDEAPRLRSAGLWAGKSHKRRASGEALGVAAKAAHELWRITQAPNTAADAVAASKAWAGWEASHGGDPSEARRLCTEAGGEDCG
ncbi:MAG: hypothetical protein H6736_22820, partial [Alphaproteobacteria bacterium]|nr:hypothetical protein [Alphaproteobacteria bacterium]